MFWNHFRILDARMVQSVESVWTVLCLKACKNLPIKVLSNKFKVTNVKQMADLPFYISFCIEFFYETFVDFLIKKCWILPFI